MGEIYKSNLLRSIKTGACNRHSRLTPGHGIGEVGHGKGLVLCRVCPNAGFFNLTIKNQNIPNILKNKFF